MSALRRLEMSMLYQQVSKGVPEALSLPPKWLDMYGDFIIKNASAVSQIESALRSLTYIIPGSLYHAVGVYCFLY